MTIFSSVECSMEDNVLVPGEGTSGKCASKCPNSYKQIEHICVGKVFYVYKAKTE